MISAIQNLVRGTDSAIARLYLTLFRERSALMPFLFHSLFRNNREIALNHVDPLERTTVAQFRQFVQYYVEHGYRFVTPADILAGLGANGKYVLITFDDGYYNNSLAIPILEEFNVPALFFISTNHIRQNKCYWWDVHYRERLARGASDDRVYDDGVTMKSLPTNKIEEKLAAEFGPSALIPRGDIDRPFSPAELTEFAAHPLVHIGNHTADHAILLNYSDAEVREQVQGAQDALLAMTGKTPSAIAYPNGGHNDRIINICEELGLKIGFTVRPHKSTLPLDAEPSGLMRLGRFTPHGDAPMVSQCRTYRSDLLFYGKFREGYLRLCRGQVAQ